MPYYRIYTDHHYELPRVVHVAKDYIRIDDVVIQYAVINKSQLQWLKQKAQGWMNNSNHKDNKQWVEAIMTLFQERFTVFYENPKL